MADHVVVGTGTRGTKILRHEYPVEEGLTAGTTKQIEPRERLKALAGGDVYGS